MSIVTTITLVNTALGIATPPYKLQLVSTGLRGQSGLSAYQVAVNSGFVGSEAAWLASLVGPPGPPGSGTSVAWGAITGTLASQTDLVGVLNNLQAQITALQAGLIMTLNKIIKVDAVTGWSAFETYAATHLEVFNSSDVAINIRRGGAGDFITLPALERKLFGGLTNANQISVQRTDGAATPVSIQAEAWTQ